MRVFPYAPVVLVYATLCVCAAPGQVPIAPPPQQAPTVLPETPVAAPQILPGGPELKPPAQDETTTDRTKDGKAPADALGKRPLTPEEIREREIERYNPLSRTNPADPHRNEDTATQSPDGSGTTGGGGSQRDSRLTPLPGSVAESNEGGPVNPNLEGPQVTENGDASGSGPQYNGPAVLSRDYTLSRPMLSKEVKWNWTIGSAESWTSGLLKGGATASDASTTQNTFGTLTTFSFSGRHFWRQDQIGISYGFGYNRYLGANAYNGANQHLALDYTHQFTRRLALNLVETGAITSANFSLQNPLLTPGVNVANINMAASPLTQLLDETTRQFYTSVGLTWQQSERLSFNLTGGFFATQLTGPQLTGNVGYQAQADTNYRLSKKTTVGAYYSFSSFTYDGHVAVSDSNTVGLIYSYAFNLTTQLRLRAGISSIETLAYTQVPIDPAFAALVGQSYGIVDIDNKRSTSDLSGQFVKDFRHGRTASASFARGVAPGNGLILASVQETATVSFATAFFRNYNFALSGGRSSLTSQAQNTGYYNYNFVGVTFSRLLPHGATSSLTANYSKYLVSNEPGLRSQFTISSGVTWGPGPGRLW